MCLECEYDQKKSNLFMSELPLSISEDVSQQRASQFSLSVVLL